MTSKNEMKDGKEKIVVNVKLEFDDKDELNIVVGQLNEVKRNMCQGIICYDYIKYIIKILESKLR
jgi:hypothetical protein